MWRFAVALVVLIGITLVTVLHAETYKVNVSRIDKDLYRAHLSNVIIETKFPPASNLLLVTMQCCGGRESMATTGSSLVLLYSGHHERPFRAS